MFEAALAVEISYGQNMSVPRVNVALPGSTSLVLELALASATVSTV